jgi:hypothetical protein
MPDLPFFEKWQVGHSGNRWIWENPEFPAPGIDEFRQNRNFPFREMMNSGKMACSAFRESLDFGKTVIWRSGNSRIFGK